jgi:hypothetical protein
MAKSPLTDHSLLTQQLNRSPWNDDEDKLIVDLQLLHGNSWAAISRALGGGRTEHSVKNRFICLRKMHGLRETTSKTQGRKRSRTDEKRMAQFVASQRAKKGISTRYVGVCFY